VSDFGLSRDGGEYYMQNSKVPVKWTAPEVFEKGKFEKSSDVWSFGITIWELFSYGHPPYSTLTNPEVLPFLKKGNRLAQPRNCPDDVWAVILDCWRLEKDQRPTFLQLFRAFSVLIEKYQKQSQHQGKQQKHYN